MNSTPHLRRFAIVAASILATAAAQATQLYYTNFDEFDPAFALSQQNFWTTNDTFNPAGAGGAGTGQSDLIAHVPGYPTGSPSTDYQAVLGGLSPYFPGSRNVAVWKPLPGADPAFGPTGYTFKSTFAITGQASDPFHDQFGFAFRDVSDAEKFRVMFTYNPGSNHLDISYGVNASTAVTTFSLGTNSTYKLTLGVDGSPVGSDSLSLSFTDTFGNTSTAATIALPDGTAEQIREAALFWDITNPAVDGDGAPLNYGANSLVVQNLEVDVVPEPVSVGWLFGGVALPLLALRRRRA